MAGIINNFSEPQFMDGYCLGEYTARHDAEVIKALLSEFFKKYTAVVIRFTPSYKILTVYPKEAPELKHCFKTPGTVTGKGDTAKKVATPSYLFGYWVAYIGFLSDLLRIPLRIKGNQVEVYEYK